MQNVNKNARTATVANVQVAATATHPVITNAMRRLQARIAQVQALRAAKNAVRKQVANQQAYQLQVAQLAAQYGMQAPSFAPVVARNARANSATVAPSASTVTVAGVAYKPCKAVHALCEQYPHYTRAQMLQLCKDNGINAATASTQVGIYRKAAAAAAAAQ